MKDLTCKEAIYTAGLDYDFETMKDSTLILDFQHRTHVEPFSMLLAAHVFRKWGKLCKQNNIDFKIKNHTSLDYAGHMGFLQSFGVNFGNHPNEARGSRSYLPITIFKVNELEEISGSRREKIQETIERKSQHLASILGQGNYELEVTLGYAIREIMRNVVEHSQSPKIYLAAQRWENRGEVEIAIFDEGVGVLTTIKENPNLVIEDSLSALTYALKPGISGKAFYIDGVLQNNKNSKWDHSGFGLYVTSELCKMGGEFTIISNDMAITYKGNEFTTYPTNIHGTGIRLRLNLDEIPGLGQQVIHDIVQRGEELAKYSHPTAVTSASKMTRIIKS